MKDNFFRIKPGDIIRNINSQESGFIDYCFILDMKQYDQKRWRFTYNTEYWLCRKYIGKTNPIKKVLLNDAIPLSYWADLHELVTSKPPKWVIELFTPLEIAQWRISCETKVVDKQNII